MSFSTKIANNIIEKYPTSAAATIINAIITVMGGVDPL
jgi:shikimate kinase